MDIRVTGVKDITQGLEKVVKEAPRLEPRAVGQIILQAARARAPVRSGQLRGSGRASGMHVTFTAPYSAPIHWGWRERNIEPNPFLVKGTESAASAWLGAFADALQEDLNRNIE
jgi:hypothetical protein